MRLALAFAALLLAACSSQSTTETKQVTENTPADGRLRAEVHTALAGEYYARGNYTVALAETRAAIKDDSSYYGAYNMQGLVLMQLRENKAASDSFNQALKLQPNNPEVLNNYGWFLCVSTSEKPAWPDLSSARSGLMYPPEKGVRLGGPVPSPPAATRRPKTSCAARETSAPTSSARSSTRADHLRARRHEGSRDVPAALHEAQLAAEPEALVMGVNRARQNDGAAEQSYLQQLRRRFPDSPEFAELTEKRQ
jgi:type IV pilus assembly protein PilF